MHFVVFGLTISSSWGNGHATLWRALCRALHARGHRVTFFERDVPYYARHRDTVQPEGCSLRLYENWTDVEPLARAILESAEVGVVTSYCPDAARAATLIGEARPELAVFYDLDTPVTLETLEAGRHVPYLPDGGLGAFDLVLSYTGGPALHALRTRLGARVVAPLYGSVDPKVHFPVGAEPALAGDLSYLGTYAADRQAALELRLLQPARRRPRGRFVLAGSQYPEDFPWTPNLYYLEHLPPGRHPAFFASSRWTLNITRAAMARSGYCPSGRLFEAAACGAAIVSDWWEGLDLFFEPGSEVAVARSADDVIALLDAAPGDAARVGKRARERTLDCHTAAVRARELEQIVGQTMGGSVACGA